MGEAKQNETENVNIVSFKFAEIERIRYNNETGVVTVLGENKGGVFKITEAYIPWAYPKSGFTQPPVRHK